MSRLHKVSIEDLRELALRFFSLSASMTGFCMASIGFLSKESAEKEIPVLADDVIVIAGCTFLLCSFLSMIALRTESEVVLRRTFRVVDRLFVSALTVLVLGAVGFLYELF